LFHMYRGETTKFNDVFNETFTHNKTYMPATSVAITAIQTLGFAVIAGSDDYVKATIDDLNKELPQMKSILECYTNFFYYFYKEDIVEFSKYNQGECRKLLFQGNTNLKHFVNGFLSSHEGDHKKAIEEYGKYTESLGAFGKEFSYIIAKEHRLMKDYKEAIKISEDYLKTSPFNSNFLFELCRAQIADGDLSGAKKTYKKLNEVWSDAEPTFLYFDEYKAMSKDLGL